MPLIRHATVKDDTRFSLTPQGYAALDAENLRAALPRLHAALDALIRRGVHADQITRHAQASGASPAVVCLIENAARVLEARARTL